MENKKLNILVTGGNGQLGCCLREASRASANRFIFTDVNNIPGLETVNLDITDKGAFSIVCDSENVDVVVNCAAYTNVEGAEDDAAFAELLNSTAVRGMAEVVRERKGTLIQISTDYVFPGDAHIPIPESATPAPVSVYGATKLSAEKAIRDSACNSIIIRTAWLYSRYGRNFVKTMLSLTHERESVNVVADQVGTPTFGEDLAKFIVHIIDSGQLGRKGIYNYTNEGVCSWYDFAHEICALGGGTAAVLPCKTGEFPTKARRPHYSVLDKSLAKSTFGVSIPHWRDSLSKCIAQLQE